MKRNLNILVICAAVSLTIGLTGCQKDDTTVVKAQAPVGPDMSAGKPANSGAVFTQHTVAAPSGQSTGNYAGGKKD